MKLRAGRLIQELDQVVRPGSGEVVVRPPEPLRFSSAAPLTGTSRTCAHHERAAESLSRRVRRRIGGGSQVFVFARRFGPDPRAGDDGPGRGLSLHDARGRLLVDFELEAEAELDSTEPWVGANCEVDPGTYRLRVDTPRWGRIERTIIASPGWQTQVFLLQSDHGEKRSPALRADLASAAVLLAGDHGFVASSEGARWVELARSALVGGRAVVAPDQLMAEAAANPMLGILGAHALLLSKDPDRAAVGAVIEELTARIGPHPDVGSLRLGLGQDVQAVASYEHPPMLTSSWGHVVAASWERRDLIPEGSLAAQAATWFWGYGPWLLWLADPVTERPAGGSSQALGEILAQVARLAPGRSAAAGLTDAEAALVSHISRSSSPLPSFDVAPGGEPAAGTPPDPDRDLARALGLPPTTLHAVAARLAEKLAAP